MEKKILKFINIIYTRFQSFEIKHANQHTTFISYLAPFWAKSAEQKAVLAQISSKMQNNSLKINEQYKYDYSDVVEMAQYTAQANNINIDSLVYLFAWFFASPNDAEYMKKLKHDIFGIAFEKKEVQQPIAQTNNQVLEKISYSSTELTDCVGCATIKKLIQNV